MKNTLSKQYGFLKFFQIFIGLSILLCTITFLIGIGDLIDSSKMSDDYTLPIVSTVLYLLFLFSSLCIISIVDFLFKLDDTKNNIEGFNIEGLRTSYYENGQKRTEGTYKDGELDGKWTRWHENGQKWMEGTYKDGDLINMTEWYENGQKNSEVTFKDGKEDGMWTGWHDNGQKECESTFKDGKKIEEIWWDWDGNEIEPPEEQ